MLKGNHKTCVILVQNVIFSESYAGYESFSFYVVNSHIRLSN